MLAEVAFMCGSHAAKLAQASGTTILLQSHHEEVVEIIWNPFYSIFPPGFTTPGAADTRTITVLIGSRYSCGGLCLPRLLGARLIHKDVVLQLSPGVMVLIPWGVPK